MLDGTFSATYFIEVATFFGGGFIRFPSSKGALKLGEN